MTVDTEVCKAVHIGNGVTTVFPHDFSVMNANHLQIWLYSNSTKTLLSSSLYSVTGIGTDSGTVTYPLSGSPLTSAQKLVVIRDAPYLQQTTISNQRAFHASSIESSLNALARQTGQLAEIVSRAVKIDNSSSPLEEVTPVNNSVFGLSSTGVTTLFPLAEVTIADIAAGIGFPLVVLTTSTTLGLAATVNGENFAVAAAGTISIYNNNAGTAQLSISMIERSGLYVLPQEPPTSAALIAWAAAVRSAVIPLRLLLGTAYDPDVDDAVPIFNAVSEAIFAAELRVENPHGVTFRWGSRMWSRTNFYTDFGAGLVLASYNVQGTANSAMGHETSIDDPLHNVTIKGGIWRLTEGNTGFMWIRLNGDNHLIEGVDAEYNGNQFCLHNNGDNFRFLNNRCVSLSEDGNVGDAVCRISGGDNFLVAHNVADCTDDAFPVALVAGSGDTRTSKGGVVGPNVSLRSQRSGHAGVSTNPAGESLDSLSAITGTTFFGNSGIARQVYKLVADNPAPGHVAIDGVTYRDYDITLLTTDPPNSAAYIKGWYYNTIKNFSMINMKGSDGARSTGLFLNAPGDGQQLFEGGSLIGGKNGCKMMRPDLGTKIFRNGKLTATNTNLTTGSSEDDDEDSSDRRDVFRVLSKNVAARDTGDFTGQPADGDTITVNGQAYRFKTAMAQAFDVQIGATYLITCDNFAAAIDLDAGAGTLYHAGTTAVAGVAGNSNGAGRIKIIADATGPSVITLSESCTNFTWTRGELVGGHTSRGRQTLVFDGYELKGVHTPTISGTPTPQHGLYIDDDCDNVDIFVYGDFRITATEGATVTNCFAIRAPAGCRVFMFGQLLGDVGTRLLTGDADLIDGKDCYPSRAALIRDAAGLLLRPEGAVVWADGIAYRRSTGATTITDLPGYVPHGDISLAHWGVLTDGTANLRSLIAAAYAHAAGAPVIWPAGNIKITLDATAVQPAAGTRHVGQGTARTTVTLEMPDATERRLFSLTAANQHFEGMKVVFPTNAGGTAKWCDASAGGIRQKDMHFVGGVTDNAGSASHQAIMIKADATTGFDDLTFDRCIFESLTWSFLKTNTSTSDHRKVKYLSCEVRNCYGPGAGPNLNSPSGGMEDVTVDDLMIRNTALGASTQQGVALSSVHRANIGKVAAEGACFRVIHIEEDSRDITVAQVVANIDGSGIALLSNNVSGSYARPQGVMLGLVSLTKTGSRGTSRGLQLSFDGNPITSADLVSFAQGKISGFHRGMEIGCDRADAVNIGRFIIQDCDYGVYFGKDVPPGMEPQVLRSNDVQVYMNRGGILRGWTFIGTGRLLEIANGRGALIDTRHDWGGQTIGSPRSFFEIARGITDANCTVTARMYSSGTDNATGIFAVAYDGTTESVTTVQTEHNGATTTAVVLADTAASAVPTIAAGGTGYTVSDVLTVSGGTLESAGLAAQFTVAAVSGGAVTAVTRTRGGHYSATPGNPAVTTGGTGTGCMLTITWTKALFAAFFDSSAGTAHCLAEVSGQIICGTNA